MPRCDTGKGLVGIDGLLGGVLALSSLVAFGADESSGGALLGLASVTFIASAVRGSRVVDECRAAFAEYAPPPDGEAPSVEEPQLARYEPEPGSVAPADPYRDAPTAPARPVVTPPVPVKPAPAPAVQAKPTRPPGPTEPSADDWSEFWKEIL